MMLLWWWRWWWCGSEWESEWVTKTKVQDLRKTFTLYSTTTNQQPFSFSASCSMHKSKHSHLSVSERSGAGLRVRCACDFGRGRGDSYQFNSATQNDYTTKTLPFWPCITKIVIVGPNSSFARQRWSRRCRCRCCRCRRRPNVFCVYKIFLSTYIFARLILLIYSFPFSLLAGRDGMGWHWTHWKSRIPHVVRVCICVFACLYLRKRKHPLKMCMQSTHFLQIKGKAKWMEGTISTYNRQTKRIELHFHLRALTS